MNSLTHTCPINIRQKSTLWWEVFNKIKIFCLATNCCPATNAIRPPPMSHTSNNYYYFGLVRWTIRMIETDLFQNLNMWRVNITDKSKMGDNFSIPLYRYSQKKMVTFILMVFTQIWFFSFNLSRFCHFDVSE